MAIIIQNKTAASVVRKSTENRNQLPHKGDIYIGTGNKIEDGSTIPDTKGQNIIDAINENATGKDISAGSFTATSFKGNADSATIATKLQNKYLHFITIYLKNIVETNTRETVCISFSFLDDQEQAYGNGLATKLLTTGSKCISGNGIIYYNNSYISFTQLSYTSASGFNYVAKVFGGSIEQDKEMYIQTGTNEPRVVDIVSKIH